METKNTTTKIPIALVRLGVAAQILSGSLSSGRIGTNSPQWLCKRAVTYADELISLCFNTKDREN